MKKEGWMLTHVSAGLLLGGYLSFLFTFSPLIENQTASLLTVFNVFYVAVTFPLEGSLTCKLLLLVTGNVIGLVWNHLFSTIALIAVAYVGEPANVMYMIINPFSNLVWAVSFWCVSLTVLAYSRKWNTEGGA